MGLSAMENTSLKLLALDGPFTVTFKPSLTPEQYADLAQVVSLENKTIAGYCEQIAMLAKVWGVEFSSDPDCS
jgi:hypothetical protein